MEGSTPEDTASTTITLQVLNLSELSAGDHYELTGAFGAPLVTSMHTRNHYGTSSLLNTLKSVADTIFANKGYKLRINDMSLPYGGPFDISNDWDVPHQTHRNGKSADISNIFVNGNAQVPLTLKNLDRWVRKTGARKKDFKIGIEASHWHLTIY